MKTAVFWDIENIAPTKKNHILDNVETWLDKMGDIVYKCVAANCYTIKREQLVNVYEKGYAIECIPKYEKNATDGILIRKIQERTILDDEIQLYVLVTQDSDFKNIIKELKEKDKFVVLLHVGNRMKKEFIKLPDIAYNINQKCNIKEIEEVLQKKVKKNQHKVIEFKKYKYSRIGVS